MGFPGQEYWSELPFPSPEDLPDPGIEPAPLACILYIAGRFYTTKPPGKPKVPMAHCISLLIHNNLPEIKNALLFK